MIDSTSNRQIKNLIQLQTRAKARREQGVFVIEGIKMYSETPRSRIVQIYVSESFYNRKEHRALLEDVQAQIVSDRVFSAISDTMTPQGILGVVRQKEYGLQEMLDVRAPLLLLLENIQDPGNLGTIFRTAEAAGVTGILMSRGTADIYNPKTIRSTMGAVYRMPFLIADDLAETLLELKKYKIRLYAAHLRRDAHVYTQEDYRQGCAFMIGNEGNGLTERLADLADVSVRIPMCGQAESLNAAVAAAVLMFEAKRQRT